MNFYLLEWDMDENWYDIFNVAVVAAETEHAAVRVHPFNHESCSIEDEFMIWDDATEKWMYYFRNDPPAEDDEGNWAPHIKDIKCTYMGPVQSPDFQDKGKHVVCITYHAG